MLAVIRNWNVVSEATMEEFQEGAEYVSMKNKFVEM